MAIAADEGPTPTADEDGTMRDAHKRLAEILLLVPAFGFLVPPVASTQEPYGLLPGLAFAAGAFSASLWLGVSRRAETWPTAAVKLILFLAFGWLLHARVAVS